MIVHFTLLWYLTGIVSLHALSSSSSSPSSFKKSSAVSWANRYTASELASGQVPFNRLVGEADRAFELGVQLEKNGQGRKATASFHEAATLYRCYLQSESDFGHVTSLELDDCRSLLAYTCTRLGFLNLDVLGDASASERLFEQALLFGGSPPSAVTYFGLGQALEANNRLHEALERYETASRIAPTDRKISFFLAVVYDRLGELEKAEALFEALRRDESNYACMVDSWGYVRWHTRKVAKLYLPMSSWTVLQAALKAAMPLLEQGGLVCEFGVGSGRSLRMIQEILPLNTIIHGFDSFRGLPHAWGNEPAGTYSTGGIVPNMEGQVYFHEGLFSETIEPFLAAVGKGAFLAFANIDCDLYSSTLDILEGFHGRVVPGTILVFDEYICHSSWRQDEFRAWRECCKRFGWRYEYLTFSLSTRQAVVRIINC